jgi:hypothetical protein
MKTHGAFVYMMLWRLNPLPSIAATLATIRRENIAKCLVKLVTTPFVDWSRHTAVQLDANLIIGAVRVGYIFVPLETNKTDGNDRYDQKRSQYSHYITLFIPARPFSKTDHVVLASRFKDFPASFEAGP